MTGGERGDRRRGPRPEVGTPVNNWRTVTGNDPCPGGALPHD